MSVFFALCSIGSGFTQVQADDSNSWIAPRVTLGIGRDSNYSFRNTDTVAAYASAAAVGLSAGWSPSMRTQLSTSHTFAGTGLRLEGSRSVASERQYNGMISIAYLTSLRSRLGILGGGFVYRPDSRLSVPSDLGAWAAMGGAWDPLDLIGFDASLGGSRTTLSRKSSVWNNREAWGSLAFVLNREGAIVAKLDGRGSRMLSSLAGFQYNEGATRTELALHLSWGGSLSIFGQARFRKYAKAALVPARQDRLLEGGGAIAQKLGNANRFTLSVRQSYNQSTFFPYSRNVIQLGWECEPVWLY